MPFHLRCWSPLRSPPHPTRKRRVGKKNCPTVCCKMISGVNKIFKLPLSCGFSCALQVFHVKIFVHLFSLLLCFCSLLITAAYCSIFRGLCKWSRIAMHKDKIRKLVCPKSVPIVCMNHVLQFSHAKALEY